MWLFVLPPPCCCYCNICIVTLHNKISAAIVAADAASEDAVTYMCEGRVDTGRDGCGCW